MSSLDEKASCGRMRRFRRPEAERSRSSDGKPCSLTTFGCDAIMHVTFREPETLSFFYLYTFNISLITHIRTKPIGRLTMIRSLQQTVEF